MSPCGGPRKALTTPTLFSLSARGPAADCVERLKPAQVDAAVGDHGRGIELVRQRVARDQLVLRAGLHDAEGAVLGREVNLAVGVDRGSPVLGDVRPLVGVVL